MGLGHRSLPSSWRWVGSVVRGRVVNLQHELFLVKISLRPEEVDCTREKNTFTDPYYVPTPEDLDPRAREVVPQWQHCFVWGVIPHMMARSSCNRICAGRLRGAGECYRCGAGTRSALCGACARPTSVSSLFSMSSISLETRPSSSLPGLCAC